MLLNLTSKIPINRKRPKSFGSHARFLNKNGPFRGLFFSRCTDVVRTALLTLITGLLAASPTWAEEQAAPDSHHPAPILYNLPSLSMGFGSPPEKKEYDINGCDKYCFAELSAPTYQPRSYSAPSSSTLDNPSSLKRKTSLDFGQSGPLSFRFTGNRLKMKIAF